MAQPTEASAAPAIDAAWAKWRPRIYRSYAIGVGLAVGAAFFESFHNLIAWFHDHRFTGIFAYIAPAMIDMFIVGGEALVLLATMENWGRRPKIVGWCATGVGLAVSVAGNIGGAPPLLAKGARGVPVAALAEQVASYATAPLALAGLSALGLMIVKRALRPPDDDVVSAVSEEQLQALVMFAGHLREGKVPTTREIIAAYRCGQPKATRIRTYLESVADRFDGFGDAADGRERVS
jgi:hypothetical protein